MTSRRRLTNWSIWAACLIGTPWWISIATGIALGHSPITDRNTPETTLRTRVSSQVTDVASPIEYTIEVLAPQGLEPVFPTVSSPWGDWEILDVRDRFNVPLENEPARRMWQRTLRLETWKSGQLTIPAVSISFGTEADVPLVSESIAVKVRSTLSENASLDQASDIHSVIDSELPEPKQTTWIWPVGMAAGLGLTLLAIAWVRRRPSRIPPPSLRFRAALQGLEQRSADDESPQGIVEDLVGAIREYFSMGLGMRDRALTDDEFLSDLRTRGLSTDGLTGLQQIFELKENVQFAGRQLTQDEIRECLRIAYDILEQRCLEPASQSANSNPRRESAQQPQGLNSAKSSGGSHGV